MTRRLHAVASQETTSAGTVTATLGLGSNIGDKSGNIDQAVAMLGQDGDVRVVAISRKYSSPPWGDLDQDWFVNACYDLFEVQTAFNPLEVAIWQKVAEECPPDELVEAIGLVSTVQGAAKDALARQYVSLASQTKVTTLNLGALFGGKG